MLRGIDAVGCGLGAVAPAIELFPLSSSAAPTSALFLRFHYPYFTVLFFPRLSFGAERTTSTPTYVLALLSAFFDVRRLRQTGSTNPSFLPSTQQ